MNKRCKRLATMIFYGSVDLLLKGLYFREEYNQNDRLVSYILMISSDLEKVAEMTIWKMFRARDNLKLQEKYLNDAYGKLSSYFKGTSFNNNYVIMFLNIICNNIHFYFQLFKGDKDERKTK